MAESVRYRFRLLRAGTIRLDGGGMFGVIPRILWSKLFTPDDLGRIEVAHNCLLLERDEGGATTRIIIETGSGNKFDEKNRKIFGLGDRTIIQAVEETGLSCEQIDHVIVTHLHFDHAGGLTRVAEPRIRRTFPRAPVYVQRQEWEDALANRSVMTRTYLRENLEPISECVRLLDSPSPFPPGHHPERTEMPRTNVRDRLSPILPGIFALRVPGHTWGQQAILFTDSRGREIVFTPDVLPTLHHAGSAFNLAYDVEPYISTVTRHWFLAAVAENDWVLVLDHEPNRPFCRVRPDGKGWYTLIPEEL